jgi:hypothetical protein
MSSLMIPCLFVPAAIRRTVAPGYPGAYALGDDRGGFMAGYVGRSDTCLQTRLLKHNHRYKFEYFIFRYAASIEESYQIECQFWHTSQGQQDLLNIRHPASPLGSNLSCPYCHFARYVTKLFTS